MLSPGVKIEEMSKSVDSVDFCECQWNVEVLNRFQIFMPKMIEGVSEIWIKLNCLA